MSGRLRRRHPLLISIAVSLLLGGCGQGPSQPGAPGVPGSASQDTAPVRVVTAVATSSTSIHLVFSSPLGTGQASPEMYRPTDPSGKPLEVLAAYPSGDGLSVDLGTRVQTPTSYALTFNGLQSRSGVPVTAKSTVTGSAADAPVLGRALAISPTEILVTFIQPLTGMEAVLDPSTVQPSSFQVSGGVSVQTVRLSQDGSSAVLTASTLPKGEFQVTAMNVRTVATDGQPSVLINPQHNQMTFTALVVEDPAGPVLRQAVSRGATSVLLQFNKPLGPMADDPAHYQLRDPNGIALDATQVALSEFRTSALLTTRPQVSGTSYTLSVSGITDAWSHPIDPAAGSLSFPGNVPSGSSPIDTTAPRVTSAGSTGSTRVLVTFSEPVRGGLASAENPSHYRITGLEGTGTTAMQSASDITAQAASLEVLEAKLMPNGTTVELTTRGQSDIQYAVVVTNVTDLAGNQLAPAERGVEPNRATFIGTPVTGGGADTDQDGLSDAEEQRGWTVNVSRIDGTTRRFDVTSDPAEADTDHDGFSDKDEKTNLTDPRDADTDDDQISDPDEYNVVFSSPIDGDTDKDTIGDGAEYSFFSSSPLLADTDGDQIRDDQEVTSSLRNARIADLPIPSIDVGGVDLRLDVRFTATSGQGRRQLDSKSASATLTQSQSNSTEQSDSKTTEWFVNAGVETTGFYNWGISEGIARGGISVTASVEGGKSGSDTSTYTRASVRSAQQEYATSLSTDKEVEYNESITREVVGAAMATGVTIKNAGNIAFTIRNLEVTAFMPNPRQPGKLIPVATLKAEGDSGSGVSVGPFNPLRGPLRFTAVQVFPALVEQLMQDTDGLIFRVTNYDITDELNRNFAYTSQQINERTAELVIDYGGALPVERYNVATSSSFGADGRPAGVTLQYLLENTLKLKHYDAQEDAALSPQQLHESYSTKVINGVEVLWRVRTVRKPEDASQQRWFFIRGNTMNDGQSFGPTSVQAGASLRLAFNQDIDQDGLTRSEEDLYGSSDTDPDTDDDGIPDADEVYGPKNDGSQRQPWNLTQEDGQLRTLHSNPDSEDSDGDGLKDCQELQLSGCQNLMLAGQRFAALLDPSDPDTDGDGIPDGTELKGYTVRSFFTNQPIVVYSNPSRQDSDNDQIPDATERRIGTNPSVNDIDRIADDDQDGLINQVEKDGWDVIITDLTGRQSTVHLNSDPTLADTDGDGVNDKIERTYLMDPRAADSDHDGLSDAREVDPSGTATNPTKADTDGDLRSDGDEVLVPWVVRVDGTSTFPSVFSDPLKADEDNDGLLDGQEFSAGTDPRDADTDGDEANDRYEVVDSRLATSLGKAMNPLKIDKLVTLRLDSIQVVGDCDPGTGGGQFEGQLGTSVNNDAFNSMLTLDGRLDNIKEGSSLTGINSSRPFYLTQNDVLHIRSSGVNEADEDFGERNDEKLQDTALDLSFADVLSGNKELDLTSKGNSDCELKVEYGLTWHK